MSWVTIVWSLIAAVCLTLALQHLLVWGRQRQAWADLVFLLSALGTAGVAAAELMMMRAPTAAEFGSALQWSHVPVWVMVAALVGFVRLYLHAGRPWLAFSVCGLRTLSLAINFLCTPNLNYREPVHLRHLQLLGESVAHAEGQSNPWMLVGNLSLFLLGVYVLDATCTVWRRGDRRKALVVGGSILFFVFMGSGQAALALWGLLAMPAVPSVFYLGIALAMSFMLSEGRLRVAQLDRDLHAAELAVQYHRKEVSYLFRVNLLGVLSGSLAHELNQPLTTILSNAQAAQRFLAQPEPDLAEVRDILHDIVADDQRAGEVIRRLRSLLEKGELQRLPVDMNEIVEEVLKLLRHDLLQRQVVVQTALLTKLPRVHGDRVHLQQVLINLIVNGCDAMRENPIGQRTLIVSTTQTPGPKIQVCVTDRGPGVAEAQRETIFQPFFTTKSHGLGLGLSVCRTIITAHEGELWADDAADDAAAFYFSLPAFLDPKDPT